MKPVRFPFLCFYGLDGTQRSIDIHHFDFTDQ